MNEEMKQRKLEGQQVNAKGTMQRNHNQYGGAERRRVKVEMQMNYNL